MQPAKAFVLLSFFGRSYALAEAGALAAVEPAVLLHKSPTRVTPNEPAKVLAARICMETCSPGKGPYTVSCSCFQFKGDMANLRCQEVSPDYQIITFGCTDDPLQIENEIPCYGCHQNKDQSGNPSREFCCDDQLVGSGNGGCPFAGDSSCGRP